MWDLKYGLMGAAAFAIFLAGLWIGGLFHARQVSANTGSKAMSIVRLYTGTDGMSHFEDMQVPMQDAGKVGFLSERIKATGIVFRETTGDYNYDFHTAPRRQYVVNLEGAVEIEVGDGSKRVLGSGEILLAEDVTGQGHVSRAVAGKTRKSLFITLD